MRKLLEKKKLKNFEESIVLDPIQTLGSVYRITDPDPNPAPFASAKKIIFYSFFVYGITQVTVGIFTSVFTNKKVTKQLKLRFLSIFCLLTEGSGSRSVQIFTDRDTETEKEYL
jgi:hypothetical protein